MVFDESNGVCRNGHERTDENTGVTEKKGRLYLECLECRTARDIRRGRRDPKKRHPRDRTACSNGHEYAEGSYRVSLIGGYAVRQCKKCQCANSKKYRRKVALVSDAERKKLSLSLSRYPIFS